MIISISPALAGPLAVAIVNLRKQYEPPDPQVREDLLRLQRALQLEVNGGQPSQTFDAENFLAQSRVMAPLLLTYRAAGDVLAISSSGVKRLADAGSLVKVGVGSGTRVTVASVEAYVTRAVGTDTTEETG